MELITNKSEIEEFFNRDSFNISVNILQLDVLNDYHNVVIQIIKLSFAHTHKYYEKATLLDNSDITVVLDGAEEDSAINVRFIIEPAIFVFPPKKFMVKYDFIDVISQGLLMKEDLGNNKFGQSIYFIKTFKVIASEPEM